MSGWVEWVGVGGCGVGVKKFTLCVQVNVAANNNMIMSLPLLPLCFPSSPSPPSSPLSPLLPSPCSPSSLPLPAGVQCRGFSPDTAMRTRSSHQARDLSSTRSKCRQSGSMKLK